MAAQLDNPQNAAMLGTVSALEFGIEWVDMPRLNDNRVSNAVPTSRQYFEMVHYIGSPETAGGDIEVVLDFGENAYDLTSLQTYVCGGDGPGGTFPDTDRTVGSVSFYVDQGYGYFDYVDYVTVAETDDVGGFDLTKVDGLWTGVKRVRYVYQPAAGSTYAPRVAEVLAISPSVNLPPQGATGMVASGGGLTLIAEGGSMVEADNLALASKGAVAFGTTPYPNASHTIAHANDGLYGNSYSWVAYEHDASGKSFIGVDLNGTFDIDSVAFGSANIEDIAVNEYADRWATTFFYEEGYDSEYTLQYTTVANPDETTPDEDWVTIGTIDYIVPGGPNFERPALRHVFTFDEVTEATGVRLVCPFAYNEVSNTVDPEALPDRWRAQRVDELEVYGEASSVVWIPGDTDGDNDVDAVDARVLAANWLNAVTQGEHPTAGDFNYDGVVDDLDASILAANWTGSLDAIGVPEPTTWGLMLSAALAGLLLRFRRR
ncbi:MAG: PEP-CTERM sorting domain-containing protein [Pirellulales bacterium]|nr:PEP-CTERM sorting domain-containing protein [Pirellulales bacterium]